MTDWLVDFSFSRLAPEDVKAAGYVGGISYLSRSPEKNWDGVYVDGSCQRPGECRAWLDAGLAVGLVWETTGTRAEQGYQAGLDDANAGNLEADALGAPESVAIYYAVDENVGYEVVAGYFAGVLAAGGRPAGAYGSQSVVEGFLDAGGRYGWQVATWGDRSPRAHVFQEPNVAPGIDGADANSVQLPDWGGWGVNEEEDEMAAPFDPDHNERDALIRDLANGLAEWKTGKLPSPLLGQVLSAVNDLSERVAALEDRAPTTTGTFNIGGQLKIYSGPGNGANG